MSKKKNEIVIYEIDLASDVPVRLHSHCTSPHQDDFGKNEINQMLGLGILVEGEAELNPLTIIGETFGKDSHLHVKERKEKVRRHPEVPLSKREKRERRDSKENGPTKGDLSVSSWKTPQASEAHFATIINSDFSVVPMRMT